MSFNWMNRKGNTMETIRGKTVMFFFVLTMSTLNFPRFSITCLRYLWPIKLARPLEGFFFRHRVSRDQYVWDGQTFCLPHVSRFNSRGYVYQLTLKVSQQIAIRRNLLNSCRKVTIFMNKTFFIRSRSRQSR